MLNGDAIDIEAETKHLLRSHQVDVAIIDIGENGHIAFNVHAVADFDDPRLLKIVKLNEL